MASTQTTFQFIFSTLYDGKFGYALKKGVAEDKGKPGQAALDFKEWLSLHSFVADKATAQLKQPVRVTFKNGKWTIHIRQVVEGSCAVCGSTEKEEWCPMCSGTLSTGGGKELTEADILNRL